MADPLHSTLLGGDGNDTLKFDLSDSIDGGAGNLDVNKALDTKTNTAFVGIYGQGVPYDKRDFDNSGANNYVLSEPYILDGIETGFQSLPKAYADRVLAAQEARYMATNQLTAATEDNLDLAPYFVYNSIFVNGKPWANITDDRQSHPELRFLSAKAAIGWHVLYNSDYTQKLYRVTCLPARVIL